MIEWRVAAVTICLCCAGGAAVAQAAPPPAHTSHKVHAKKAAQANDFSEDWTIAEPKATSRSPDIGQDPNLAQGRKKFFEQSTTVQGGGPAAHGNTSGFTPSMGLSF